MSPYGYGYDGGWAPYVPVAERRRLAVREANRRLKKGQSLAPIRITSRQIAKTFWGTAWCDNLTKYSDYSNRLPRGRTYARNGSIIDLQIERGKISAIVAGSSPYDIVITIQQLDATRWRQLKKQCAESVHSLIDLMRGELPEHLLRLLTDPQKGLFPSPKEMRLRCNCPDGASLCKHLAAVLYGIGHRLDTQPELFFLMRGVNQGDLISEALTSQSVDATLGLDQENGFENRDLESIFGIDLAVGDAEPKSQPKRKLTKKKRSVGSTQKTGRKKVPNLGTGKKAKKRAVSKPDKQGMAFTNKKATKKKAATKKAATKKVG